jgi:mono/diheme cytochrome c family protein
MRLRALALVPIVLALAACGGGKTAGPFPKTVIGTVPTAPTVAKGAPARGKALFASSGCGGCHTFKPAATNGKVGPDLDKLAADALKAKQGSLEQYTFNSIKNPSAYVVPGYPNGVMPNYGTQLTDQQIADLVAFLTKKS